MKEQVEELNKKYQRLESEWMKICFFGGCEQRKAQIELEAKILQAKLGDDLKPISTKPIKRNYRNDSFEDTLARNGE